MTPLVSVITATYQRHEQLRVAVESVQRQTFGDFEHIIVADGPDEVLLRQAWPANVRCVELGRNWCIPGVKASVAGRHIGGAVPRNVGNYLARGRYIAYLDDDNEWYPHHLSTLVAAIQEHSCDFVYSRYRKFVRGEPSGEYCPNYGKNIPAKGDIDTNTVLHRWELLNKASWRGDIRGEDWHLILAWLKAGATFTFVDEVTVRYNAWH